MVETSSGFSSTFKLVLENCVSYTVQPAVKHPLHYLSWCVCTYVHTDQSSGVFAMLCVQVNEVKDRVELQPPRGVHAKAARKRAEEEAAPVKKSAKPKKEVKEEKEDEGSAEPPPPKPKKKKVAKKASPSCR